MRLDDPLPDAASAPAGGRPSAAPKQPRRDAPRQEPAGGGALAEALARATAQRDAGKRTR